RVGGQKTAAGVSLVTRRSGTIDVEQVLISILETGHEARPVSSTDWGQAGVGILLPAVEISGNLHRGRPRSPDTERGPARHERAAHRRNGEIWLLDEHGSVIPPEHE